MQRFWFQGYLEEKHAELVKAAQDAGYTLTKSPAGGDNLCILAESWASLLPFWTVLGRIAPGIKLCGPG